MARLFALLNLQNLQPLRRSAERGNFSPQVTKENEPKL